MILSLHNARVLVNRREAVAFFPFVPEVIILNGASIAERIAVVISHALVRFLSTLFLLSGEGNVVNFDI